MTVQLLYLLYHISCSIGRTNIGEIPSVSLKIIEKYDLFIRIKKMHSSIYADDFYLKAGAKQNCMQNNFLLPKSLASKSSTMKKRDDK